jgi:hypothetical protein
VRRIAILAFSVWIATFVSIGLFTLFWRIGYFRPHVLWGILSLAATFVPLAWLVPSALWRGVRGPCRLRAIGWLLVGVTPLVWIGAYVTQLVVDVHTRTPREPNALVRVTAVWASTIFDIEARWRYPSWTRGRHAVLIDDGRAESPEKLVAEMDRHIEAMADLLGQAVPNDEFLWVRGSIFGFNGRAIHLWAICAPASDPAEIVYVDRHEVAHTLITALCGPDQDPPCLFAEGWAESRSTDRGDQILRLARARKDGRALPLQELVAPAEYHRMGPDWAYWEGGPLVHYLIERYGPKTFFRLYSGVRCDTFQDDCRAILGDSWETVDEGFWKWVESEAGKLAQSRPKRSAATTTGSVEFAKSVNPADWQALVAAYREGTKDFRPFPSNAAFVLEADRIEKKAGDPGPDNRTHSECRAVFEGQQFWIFDNNVFSANGERFLMATPARRASLVRDKSGVLRGEAKNAWPRDRVCDFLAFCQEDGAPIIFLPLREDWPNQGTCRVERLVRPAKGNGDKWEISFAKRFAKDDPEAYYEIELDPASHWRITREVIETKGEWRSETDTKYAYLGDVFLPVASHTHSKSKQREATVRCQAWSMSQAERQALKQRVEQAAAQCESSESSGWLWRSLLALVIGCPIVGATLLVTTRRCKPPEGAH